MKKVLCVLASFLLISGISFAEFVGSSTYPTNQGFQGGNTSYSLSSIKDVMGMYDVQPTIGNMLNFYNPYALGSDIFSKQENVVVFPSGNWITNRMYYNSQKEEGYSIQNEPVSVDYIEKYTKLAETKVSISDKIIVYNLFDKIKNKETKEEK